MVDPGRNYDAWLEEPYQRRAAEGEAFVVWCEANGYQPGDDEAAEAYERRNDSTDDDFDGPDPDLQRDIEREIEWAGESVLDYPDFY